MAHAARLNSLTEGLVTSITGLTTQDKKFRASKDQATKGLKDQSHARTNQFQIAEKYAGLVEKFGVLNREDLGDALQTRLDELPTNSRWLPEILSLLLELQDRPVEKTDLDDVEALNAPLLETGPTWEEIIADDPITDDDIWNDVERGYHSSGDDFTIDGDSDATGSTQATSVNDQDVSALARLHVIQPNTALLDPLRDCTKSKHRSPKRKGLSELSAIRQSLTMLHGLPTRLYQIDPKSAAIRLDPVQAMETPAKRDIYMQLAAIGTRVNRLRAWSRSDQKLAYVQSMQASCQKLLMGLTSSLSQLEQQYIRPQIDTVVSLVDVRAQVETLARPFAHLSDIVRQSVAEQREGRQPYSLLDLLYDDISAAQMAGDDVLLEILTSFFFAGLRSYLKPVYTWIKTGTLPSQDHEVFLAMEADSKCELGEAWHKRFALRYSADDTVCAPAFMQSFVLAIFAMGKSQAFLRLLGQNDDSMGDYDSAETSNRLPDIATLQDQLKSNPLLPFSILLNNMMDTWMQSLDANKSLSPQRVLYQNHNLDALLKSLGHVFFAQDGSRFQDFADDLFQRITRDPQSWKNEFLLTALAQNTLGTSPLIDRGSIAIRTTTTTNEPPRTSLSRSLEALNLTYRIPWPLQNITLTPTPPTHAQAFIFALQAHHAAHILRPELFTLRALTTSPTSRTNQTQTNFALHLRKRLLWFTDILQDHISTTCTTLHRTMLTSMASADGVDAMASTWAAYEKTLQMRLLLASKLSPIRTAVTNILEMCEQFAVWWEMYMAPVPANASTGSDGENKEEDRRRSSMRGVDTSREMSRRQAEFQKWLSFITAGLRGVSRASGESALEALAERLEWSN